MAVKFTPKQQEVIDLRNCNILVSAAAGSGKTAVLVERIVQMVCDKEHPVDIDRLLVVTFTNAAAAEMRERISARISECLQEEPENEHLQKQATLIHNAQITTIDSFSLFLIRNHFNEIGLDPAFRVADEGEIKLLRREVLQELLEDAYASGEEDFHACVEYFCHTGRESVLENHIINLSAAAASFPWPEEWLEERKTDYAADSVEALEQSTYGQYLLEYVNRMAEGCLEKEKEIRAICERPDGPYMYGELIDAEIEFLERITRCTSLSEYAAALGGIQFKNLPSKKDDSVSPMLRELAKELRGEVKSVLQQLNENYFKTPLELWVEQGMACRKPVSVLLDLVIEFDRRMLAKKQERKIIDFADMEHYALSILLERDGDEIRPSRTALEYRQHFHEILTDEYQDSNLVQEYLLRAVSGEEDGHFNRFMVGDVKQSIYKFRLARPELFLEKYDTYSGAGDLRRIDLSMNFRSRVQVIDTVNRVFERLMSRETGGVDYDDKAALYAGAKYPEQEDCDGELLLIEKPGKESELGAKEAEALAIAHKIKALRRDFMVTEKATGELRPARFSDMVILLRTNAGWDEVFKKVLEQEGIPVYTTSKTGYFAASEVQELLQVFRVMNNPYQDIPLYGVMKSVFGGFAEEEIAYLRSLDKTVALYEIMRRFVQGEVHSADTEVPFDVNGLRERLADFLTMIDRYRGYAVYLPVRELLQRLVAEFDYLNYVTALPGGSKRRANVEMLFTKASDFEKTSYAGVFQFVRYMEQLEKYDVDYGEADVVDENADVVRIMSIHKSKGLEFPITFVAGLTKRFNMQDANQSLVVDTKLGLGTDFVDADRRLRNKTLRRAVLSVKMREENLAEEIRILYVALTRAKEKLILTGVMQDAAEQWEIACEAQKERISYPDFMLASDYLDWLLPILPHTGIKVSVCDEESLIGEGMAEQVHMAGQRSLLEQAELFSDEERFGQLQARLSYQYPHSGLANLYTKTTVSELKVAAMAESDEAAYHSFEEKEVVPYIPAFRREKESVSGTVRGNAYHRIMELLDWNGMLGELCGILPQSEEAYLTQIKAQEARLKEALQVLVNRECEELRLGREYASALRMDKLVHFMEQPLAYRIWKAEVNGALYREQPFVLGLSAGRLGEQFPEDETVLIQGIIDLFFVEDGEIVLLDYKTDVIDSMEDLWNRYATQLDYYGETLTKVMALPVKEKLLYSFYLEEASCR